MPPGVPARLATARSAARQEARSMQTGRRRADVNALTNCFGVTKFIGIQVAIALMPSLALTQIHASAHAGTAPVDRTPEGSLSAQAVTASAQPTPDAGSTRFTHKRKSA
jgi:hypothetical protein